MLTIKKDYEIAAKNATSKMVSDLSQMAKVVLSDYLSFDDVCDEMGCDEEELEAILNNTVEDMNISEYNHIKCYFNSVIQSYNDDGEMDNTGIYFEDNGDYIENDDEKGDSNFRKNSDNKGNLIEFINNINNTLPDECKIDVNDAMNAREDFNNDYLEQVRENYDKIARESNFELFGTYDDIGSMDVNSLKKLVIKNGLYTAIAPELRNDKRSMLKALYDELEKRIQEKSRKKYRISDEDIEDIDRKASELNKKFLDNIDNIIDQFL